jgi:hypothetical protein
VQDPPSRLACHRDRSGRQAHGCQETRQSDRAANNAPAGSAESRRGILRASAGSQRRGQGSPNKSPARGDGAKSVMLCHQQGLPTTVESKPADSTQSRIFGCTARGYRKSPAGAGLRWSCGPPKTGGNFGPHRDNTTETVAQRPATEKAPPKRG